MRKNSEAAKVRTRTRRSERRAKSAAFFLFMLNDDRTPVMG